MNSHLSKCKPFPTKSNQMLYKEADEVLYTNHMKRINKMCEEVHYLMFQQWVQVLLIGV